MVSQFVFGSGLFLLKEVSWRRQRREGRGDKLQVTCGRHLPWQPPLEPHYLQGSRSYQRQEPPKKKNKGFWEQRWKGKPLQNVPQEPSITSAAF